MTSQKTPGAVDVATPGLPRKVTILAAGLVWRLQVVVLVAVVLAFATCGIIRVVHPPQKTYRWVVPESMRGVFVIHFKVAGSQSLAVEDGFRVVRIPAGSRVTSTSDEYVFGHEYFSEEYYVEGPSGRKRVTAVCRPLRSVEHVPLDVRCDFP